MHIHHADSTQHVSMQPPQLIVYPLLNGIAKVLLLYVSQKEKRRKKERIRIDEDDIFRQRGDNQA